MTSNVDIVNRALQKLGSEPIVSLTENSPSARRMARAYPELLKAELQAHPWNFAKARAQLSPSSTAPAFGFDYQYLLPTDCLQAIRSGDDPEWQIEGRKILTDTGPLLNIQYIRLEEDTNVMDALFHEVLASRLAIDLAEVFTQSRSKAELLLRGYNDALRTARKRNAFANPAQKTPSSEWVLARL